MGQKRKLGTAPRKPRSKRETAPGVPLVDAVFAFWADLFPGDAAATDAIARWIRDTVVGATDGGMVTTVQKIAPLATDDAARVSVSVSGVKVEMTMVVDRKKGEVAAKSSRLFTPGIRRGYSSAWAKANPIGNFISAKARWGAAEVEGILEFAVARASAKIIAAFRDRLAEGRLIMSGGRPSNLLTGSRIDVPSGRASQAQFDFAAGRVVWPQPAEEVLVEVEVRLASIVSQSPAPSQSFAKEDDVLVKEMQQLILSGEAKSATEAAKIVAPKARRKKTRKSRDGDGLDSVVERLRRRLGVKPKMESMS